MAVKQRSFWSTTNGLVTGIAGTLTGIVGIATVAAQLGWIGSEDNESPSAKGRDSAGVASSTTAEDDRGSGGDDERAGRAATAEPKFTVDPSAVSFQALGEHTATVALRNTGSVELNVDRISVDGEDDGQFSVSGASCTRSAVAPGRSCQIEVSFAPDGSGTAKATMVIEVEDATVQEVPLSGRPLL